MAHELVGRRTAARSPTGLQPRHHTEDDRSGGEQTEYQDHAAEMSSDRQGQSNVGDSIADIVEIGPEPAADIELGG